MTQASRITLARLDALRSRQSLPLAADLAVLVAATLVKWDLRHRTRRALSRLTPEQLRDVGLTPEMAAQETLKRFWQA